MDTSAIVNSAEFTSEQKEYLQGFFAGLAQRGLAPFVGHTADGRITSDPSSDLPNQAVEPLWFNTPTEDLVREERWKLEQDPFSLWEKLLQYANRNEPPADDDRFRIKYFGFFYVAPAQDSFMLRRMGSHGTEPCGRATPAPSCANWSSGATISTPANSLNA